MSKLSKEHILSIVKPLVDKWLTIAKEKYGNSLLNLGDDLKVSVTYEDVSYAASISISNDKQYVLTINGNNTFWLIPYITSNIIGHEIAHYIHLVRDFALHPDVAYQKWISNMGNNGGHNYEFQQICNYIGVNKEFQTVSVSVVTVLA